MKTLVKDDFISLLGGPLPPTLLPLIQDQDWSYEEIQGHQLNKLVDSFLVRISNKDFSIVNPEDKSRWNKGWGENRDAFLQSGDVKDLQPKYIRKSQPMRLMGRFIRPNDPNFEANWYYLFQEYIFRTYLNKAETIMEFGCGSGINIARLTEMYPDKKIIGVDWAQESVDIVNHMKQMGKFVEGKLFDFFHPDYKICIPKNTAVFTFGALEQTSNKWEPFMDYLFVRHPELCVFIEPLYELYNTQNLMDHLAIRAHDVRHFMKGLVPYLHKQVKKGHVCMVKERRANFGSLVLEGYSQLIWKPVL